MRSDLLSQDRPREFKYKCLRMVNTPLVQNRGKNMDKNLLKELSVEELKQLQQQVKKEINRRTIKIVDQE